MALRATATAGSGRSANVNTDSITVPTTGPGGTVIAGDTAFIFLDAVSTGANTPVTPSGWSIVSPGILIGTTSEYAIVYGKTLVSGDIGAAVTLAWTGFVRPAAAMIVESGVSFAGRLVPTPTQNGTGGGQTTAPLLPSQGSVTTGSTIICALSRRNAAIGGSTVNVPAGYTEVAEVQTAYADPADATVTIGRKVASSAGTYGGEAASTTPASAGVNYLIVVSSAGNVAPTSNAGIDQTVEPWTVVDLIGTDSDTDGTVASRQWTQTSGPSVGTLTGATTAHATFVAPASIAGTVHGFTYTVVDNGGVPSPSDPMTVTVRPVTERAVIGGVEVPMQFRSI